MVALALGVQACFNTRHRWVAPQARYVSLPSAASSGCPDSELMRLTATKMPISPHSLSLILTFTAACLMSKSGTSLWLYGKGICMCVYVICILTHVCKICKFFMLCRVSSNTGQTARLLFRRKGGLIFLSIFFCFFFKEGGNIW